MWIITYYCSTHNRLKPGAAVFLDVKRPTPKTVLVTANPVVWFAAKTDEWLQYQSDKTRTGYVESDIVVTYSEYGVLEGERND